MKMVVGTHDRRSDVWDVNLPAQALDQFEN